MAVESLCEIQAANMSIGGKEHKKWNLIASLTTPGIYIFFFAEPNANFLALVCYSSLCFLRLWYFEQFLNHLTYHAEQIKAKFVPCSSSFLVMDSMVILFYYYYFFNLENLFLICFLFVCSKDSSCIYDLIIYCA